MTRIASHPTPPATARAVIAVGASAGGIEALGRFLGELPESLPAAVLVVLHLAPQHRSLLPGILARRTALPVEGATTDPVPLLPGHVYVAAPDHHLTVTGDAVAATGGPRENGHRPAFDATLRSVAAAFGSATLGVVLSGSRDDGTLGLLALAEVGGQAMAQDPAESQHEGMPTSAIAGDDVSVVAPAAELGRRAASWAITPSDDAGPKPAAPEGESEPTVLSCPECGGVLSRLPGDRDGFSCQVGHRYGEDALRAEQARRVEASLWSSSRQHHERARLLRGFAAHARAEDDQSLATHLAAEAAEAQRRAQAIGDMAKEGSGG